MDQPNLGFGFYRVMHANVAQVLDGDLSPQVLEEFHQYKAEDGAVLKDKLSKMVAGGKVADKSLDDSPKIRGYERVRVVGTVRAAVREPAVAHGPGNSIESLGLARSRDRTDCVGERGIGKNEVRLGLNRQG